VITVPRGWQATGWCGSLSTLPFLLGALFIRVSPIVTLSFSSPHLLDAHLCCRGACWAVGGLEVAAQAGVVFDNATLEQVVHFLFAQKGKASS